MPESTKSEIKPPLAKTAARKKVSKRYATQHNVGEENDSITRSILSKEEINEKKSRKDTDSV